ncbi:MAG: hypothetical protein HOK94_02165 [Candidatus Marinimicrobia bacterium]|nr:hypothetical protein [Candidatus Neomarinimicrobiota bacterium]MBT5460434.1 hypothetical protein [Candidatus Neomarinimicrobiota bacterium]MBT7277770.1 hypothetical protein [Candidatus Neomarinimicrobiota bacterium]
MKNFLHWIVLFLLISSILTVTVGCESPLTETSKTINDDDDDDIETLESSYYDDESHNNGQNCMSCHIAGGEGEGIFTVAGSVFKSDFINPYPNATVNLYKSDLSSIIYTLQVDGLGNFYTTESVDLSFGCLPQVSASGNTVQMATATTVGACNGCHNGITESFIYLTSE